MLKIKRTGDVIANQFLSSQPLYDKTNINLATYGMTGWDFTLTGAFYEGLSLQDIFETNNLVDVISSWSYAQPPGSYVSEEEIGFGGTYSTTVAENIATLTTAEKYYFGFRIYDVLKFAVTNILDTENYVAVAEYNDGTIRLRKAQAVEFTPTLTDGIRLELIGSKSGRISYARLLNVDTLFTTAPSKAQMDMWYNIYVFMKTRGTENSGVLDNDYYIDITNLLLVEPTATFTTSQEIADFKVLTANSSTATYFKFQNTTKFTNLYGTSFLVWQTLTLAAIFGEGYVIAPNDTLQVPTVWTNQYYDTETKTITVGELGGNLTFTNNTESPITVYVVNITTTFSIKPNVTQMNDMEKMFLMYETTNEIIVLLNDFYVDYVNNIIYNLTTIYGAGNGPSLTAFEKILSPSLKAKAFATTLQQEFMELTLTTPINLLEEYTLTDVFVNSQAVSTPAETLAILEDIYETLAETTILTGTAFVLGQFYVDYDNFKAYDIVDINRRLPIYNNLSLNQIFGTYDTTGATVIEEAKTPTRSIVLLNGNYYYINGDYKAKTFATLYTMAQYDSMLEYYKGEVLELLSVKSSLDTPIYEGLSLRDIFESEEISATGKNLFDGLRTDYKLRRTYSTPTNVSLSNGVLTITGSTSGGRFIAYNFPLIIGKTYTLQYSNSNNIEVGFVQYDTIQEYWAGFGGVLSPFTFTATKQYGQLYFQAVDYTLPANIKNVQLEQSTVATTYESYLDLAMILETPSLYGTVDLVHCETGSLFTTAPSQAQLDEWLDMYLTLKDNETLITDYLAKTRMLPLIVKAKIYKDRFVILGSYTIIGE